MGPVLAGTMVGLILSSCSTPADQGREPAVKLPPAAMGTASIRGTVKFEGTPPVREPVRMGRADPTCHKTHDGRPPLQEDVVVNENGTLRDVIVSVKTGLKPGSYDVTSEPAVLNQVGCVYEPHVLSLQAGQELKILNSDDTVHNVNGQGKVNEKFNFSMLSSKAPPRIVKFEKAEYPPLKIKCDVHPWMLSWAAVFDHPYHDVTGLQGSFEIGKLPAGSYTIEAWHRHYGTQTVEVTLADGEQAELNLSYKAEADTGK